jgi:nucleoid-associated protein YgaU
MKRTRVRWGRLAVLGAVVLSPFAAHAAADASAGGRAAAVRTYVVRPGDTLWSIAARVSAPGADLRPVVDELERANHLGSAIVPGEVLHLP